MRCGFYCVGFRVCVTHSMSVLLGFIRTPWARTDLRLVTELIYCAAPTFISQSPGKQRCLTGLRTAEWSCCSHIWRLARVLDQRLNTQYPKLFTLLDNFLWKGKNKSTETCLPLCIRALVSAIRCGCMKWRVLAIIGTRGNKLKIWNLLLKISALVHIICLYNV